VPKRLTPKVTLAACAITRALGVAARPAIRHAALIVAFAACVSSLATIFARETDAVGLIIDRAVARREHGTRV
jgi:hypothetical protein